LALEDDARQVGDHEITDDTTETHVPPEDDVRTIIDDKLARAGWCMRTPTNTIAGVYVSFDQDLPMNRTICAIVYAVLLVAALVHAVTRTRRSKKPYRRLPLVAVLHVAYHVFVKSLVLPIESIRV